MILAVMGLTGVVSCASDAGEYEEPQMVLNVGSEETFTAGQDVVFIQIKATDPQDMELEFEAVDIPDRATFDTYRNEALFNWDPLISDVTDGEPHRLVFAVSNEAGLTVERTVHVHIDAGDEGTHFLNSSSQLYNPSSGGALEFDVRVRNDLASLVVLSMPEATAPEGASFEQTDDFEGKFSWTPNPEQAEQRTHSVIFEADDNEEVVEQQVTIVIQDPDIGTSPPGGGETDPTELTCSEDQVIAHEPLGAQRTAAPYLIEGQIDDDSQNWDEVLLYWTLEDPIDVTPDYEMKVLEMEGTQFSGEIPNLELDPGETAEMSYAICAFSDDDEEGLSCVPDEFLYRFIAYSPDDEKCRDDGIDYADPDEAGQISTEEWNAYRVCEEQPKYHELELVDGEEAEVTVSYPPATSPKIDFLFDGEPVEAEDLPCVGLSYVEVEGPGTVQVRVAGDELPYHVTGFLFGDEPVEPEECPGEEYEPNDTPAQATLIVDDFAAYEEMGICEEDDIDVFATRLVRGDKFDAYLFFEHDEGDLDMTLFAPSQDDEVVDGGFGVAQGWSSDDDEEISYTAEESGFYYLSVVTVSEPNTYELLTERVCEVDDEFAGNHELSDAASIDFETYEGLKLCENQPDYFRLTQEGGGDDITWMGEIRAEYGSLQSMEVRVYDESGTLVTEGEAVQDRIDFYVEPEPGESFDVEIEASSPMLYELNMVEFDF